MSDNNFKTLDDIGDVTSKRILVRVDLNVPMADGEVTDDTRLQALVPTVTELADKGAKVLLLAHFGRPKGEPKPELSLKQVVPALSRILGRDVSFLPGCAGQVMAVETRKLANGSVCVLENTRFHPGEETNDDALVEQMAKLGDIYVNDAFSAAHRAHASTVGLANVLPAYAGRSMERELTALDKALGNPEHPVAAVVGGAKVSSKLDVLRQMVEKVDHLIIRLEKPHSMSYQLTTRTSLPSITVVSRLSTELLAG